MFICMYIVIRHPNIVDGIFTGNFVRSGDQLGGHIYFNGGQFGYWNLTHFLFFLSLGIICPNKLLWFQMFGILWEIMEFYFEYDKQVTQTPLICKYIRSCKGTKKITSKEFFNKFFGRKKGVLYFCSSGIYGQIIDVVANSSGYLLGSYFFNKYLKKKNCNC